MAGYFRIMMITIVAGLVAMAAANYLLGYRGHFIDGVRAETWMADALNRGVSVAGDLQIAVDDVQIERIAGMAKPDVVVLGSSRSMTINRRTVGARSLANLSVDTADLIDDIALVGLLRAADKMPHSLILGVDPWIFKDQKLSVPPGAVAAARRMVARLGGDPAQVESRTSWPPSAFLSLDRLGAVVRDRTRTSCNYLDRAPDGAAQCLTRHPDGSLEYAAAQQDADPESVAAAVRISAAQRGRMHGFENYDRPAEWRERLFEAFLDDLQRDHVTVVLFIPPYHPDMVAGERERPDWALVSWFDGYIRRVADARSIRVLGGSDLHRPECGRAAFYDAYHAKPGCVDAILAPIHGTL